MAEPMGTALRKAAEAAAKIESVNTEGAANSPTFAPVEERPAASTGVSFHAAASAPAPAREKAQPIVPPAIVPEPAVTKSPALQINEIKIEEAPAKAEPDAPYYPPTATEAEPAPPTFFPGAYDPDEVEGGSKVKAIVIVAMVVLLACSAAYLSWRNASGKGSPVSSPSQSTAPASATPKPEAGQASQPISEKPAASQPEVSDITLGGPASAPSSKPSATKPSAKPAASAAATDDTEPEVTQRLIVKSDSSHTPKRSAPQEQENIQAPAVALGAAPDAKALAGLSTDAALPKAPAQVVRVSQGVMEGLILKRVQPHYPAQAMQMRVQGPVQLQATISKTGDITNVKVVSGDGILARAAQDAVKQWKYKPYYLNGDPVEIQTQILVNFKLPN